MFWHTHNEKKGCFAIGLVTQFLSCKGHLKFTIFIHCECQRTSYMSCRVVTHRIYSATQLQLSQNKLFSTIMQLHYNYTDDIMLMSLIVIHLLKSNMWHYEKI